MLKYQRRRTWCDPRSSSSGRRFGAWGSTLKRLSAEFAASGCEEMLEAKI
jgi:hypothetical protein